MIFRSSSYQLNEKNQKYFICFCDSTGVFQELEVTKEFYLEFRQLERKNRNLQQSDWRHNEHSELTEQTLHRRAKLYPQSVDEIIIEAERSELLHHAITILPEIQQRRFLLYYEYDLNYYEIGAMEHCTAQAVRRSVIIAREKTRAQMEKYLCA